MKVSAPLMAFAAMLLAATTGCGSAAGLSSQSESSAFPSAPLTAVAPITAAAPTPDPSLRGDARDQAYQRAVLADAPVAFWTLQDAPVVPVGGTVVDEATHAGDATVVRDTLLGTPGPLGSSGVKFSGAGQLVTPLSSPLVPGHPFTLEFFFRADDCTRHWTQVLGTADYGTAGRQGVNMLHYPRFFPGGCHLAVEFWKDDRYTGGCGPRAAAQPGTWSLVSVVYDGHQARCFQNGQLTGQASISGFGVGGPFGIGGAGSGYAGTLDSGSLADVAIYDRALAPSVIAGHARVGGPRHA